MKDVINKPLEPVIRAIGFALGWAALALWTVVIVIMAIAVPLFILREFWGYFLEVLK